VRDEPLPEPAPKRLKTEDIYFTRRVKVSIKKVTKTK
jgi:hypothetical protein